MPIYEYQCTACGKIEEAIQKVSDAPLTDCTHCSGKLNKLISHSTFHLKGSGWYVTDYAKKGNPQPSAANDGGNNKSSQSPEKSKSTEPKSAKADSASGD